METPQMIKISVRHSSLYFILRKFCVFAIMASSGKVEQLELSVWPKHIIKCYIDIMVEEVTKGNMKNGFFSSKVWKNMLEKLNAESQRTFSFAQVKQKFNRLRTKHREFFQLLQHTEFGWDAETNTVTANEEVWNNYIVAHPEASQFKKHRLEHYKLLCIIFNRSTATGVLHHASMQDYYGHMYGSFVDPIRYQLP